MASFLSTKLNLMGILASMSLLWLLHGSFVLADCDKCESPHLTDCTLGTPSPLDGGPPCSCSPQAMSRGCTLKPCLEMGGKDITCDSTMGSGNAPISYSYRCRGASGQCESCKDLPPDCTFSSYSSPPASGGPACSCANQITPSGCTLKPCTPAMSPTPCVCQPGVYNVVFCFNATCPGSFKSEGGGSGSAGVRGAQAVNLLIATVVFGTALRVVLPK